MEWTESAEIGPYAYGQLTLTEVQSWFDGEMIAYCTYGGRTIKYTYAK